MQVHFFTNLRDNKKLNSTELIRFSLEYPNMYNVINTMFSTLTDTEKLDYIEFYVNNIENLLSTTNIKKEKHSKEIINFALNSKFAEQYCTREIKSLHDIMNVDLFLFNDKMFILFVDTLIKHKLVYYLFYDDEDIISVINKLDDYRKLIDIKKFIDEYIDKCILQNLDNDILNYFGIDDFSYKSFLFELLTAHTTISEKLFIVSNKIITFHTA